MKVAGPASYLAAKADALRRRNKNKDAYDIVWLSECWPGGQAALALELRKSAVFTELDDTWDTLRSEFANVDASGAVKYARFMATEVAARDQHAQRAVGAMRELLDAVSHEPS